MVKRLLITAVVLCLLSGLSVSALSTSLDYQYDEQQQSVAGPATFEFDQVLYGNTIGTGALDTPADLYVDGDKIYIADAGNDRVLVLDSNYRLIREIKEVKSTDGKNMLYNPNGVFVREGLLYICDTNNARVIAIDETNTVVLNIAAEGLVSVNENFVFKPEKVAVDSSGNVLVVSSSIYQGILRFSPDGEFKTFYAPNQVPASAETFINAILKLLMTDAQKESLQKQLPSPYNNLYIDDEDFVFTTAAGVGAGQDVKCLNSAGSNILEYSSIGSADAKYGDYEAKYRKTAFVDIHADEDGYMLVAEQNSNKLFLYDSECNLVAITGGFGEEKGQFRRISAVEKFGANYLVLDSAANTLTVMKPTEYLAKLKNAMQYYHEGKYTESEQVWLDLLEENSNLPLAYCSLGRAQYHLGNYRSAMDYLEQGGDTYFYSLAKYEYRKEVVDAYFGWLLLGGVAVCVAAVFLFKWIHKKLSE